MPLINRHLCQRHRWKNDRSARRVGIVLPRPWFVLFCSYPSRASGGRACATAVAAGRGTADCRLSEMGVRRVKAALSSGCKPYPATVPAGSNRSSHGDNEVAEALD